jgi:predicted nucleic acid-binding protein
VGTLATPEGLLDTNICIDELRRLPQAREAVNATLSPAISLITWMEVMAGTDLADESITRRYLDSVLIIPITSAIAERAAILRRGSRLKLPDAVILATAQVEGRILVTRNTRDFGHQSEGILIPYQL